MSNPKDVNSRPALFEDVLDNIGSCGPAQIIILIGNILTDICACFSMFFFTLEGAHPQFICADAEPNQCPDEGCHNVTFTDEYTSLTTEFGLVCERMYYMKTTSTIYFAGVLVGSALSSISDYVGRKKVVIAMFLLSGTLQGSLGFIQSLEVYMVMKFFVGVSAGTLCAVSPHLVVEYMGIKWRKIVAVSIGWASGYAIVGFIAFLFRPWRQLTLTLGGITISCGIVFLFLLPESARWYIQQGRYDEALKQLNWIATLNRKPRMTETDIELLKKIRAESRRTERRYNFMDMFRTKAWTLITVIFSYAYFATSLIHYGLANMMGALIGAFHINLIAVGVINFFIRLTSFYVLEKLGRRYGLVFYLTPPVLMFFVIVILDLCEADVSDYVRTWLAVVSLAVLGGVWNTIMIFVVETYPTLLRGTAYAFHLTMTRIGGMIAPQVGLLGMTHNWIPYAIFGCLGVAEIVLMTSLVPETRGKPLIENLEDMGKKVQLMQENVELQNGEHEVQSELVEA